MARPDLFARFPQPHATAPAHRLASRRDGVRVEVDGHWRVGFCGSDHLGLSQHFGVVNALQDAAAREGVGSGMAHLDCGRHALHEMLEGEVADWLGYPRAMVFGSALAANLAVQQALLGEEDDLCVHDTLNHPSLLDATRLAGARLRRYPHLDTEGAMRQLRTLPDSAAMLVTEGVFGMDGDSAPLRALSLIARVQEALLYVDDAHGIGVVGEAGRGSVAAAGLGVEEVPLQVVALDRALGTSGALVLGTVAVVQRLADSVRPCAGGATLPPAQAAAALEAVRLARRDHWRREKLAELVALFRGSARRHGLALMASETPIQPLLCGNADDATAMVQALQQAGHLVGMQQSPALAEGQTRLRISLSALHTPEQVQALVDAIAQARDRLQPATAAHLGA